MGGFLPFSFLIAQFIAVELFRVGTNLWLTKWTSEYERLARVGLPHC